MSKTRAGGSWTVLLLAASMGCKSNSGASCGSGGATTDAAAEAGGTGGGMDAGMDAPARPGAGGEPTGDGSGGNGGAAGGASGHESTTIFPTSPANRKLDLLLMVDDSASMKPLQMKLAQRLPDFIQDLRAPTSGLLPDLHVAVITSSMGAGAFTDVPGCGPGVPGSDEGRFQHRAGCGLNAGETFIKTNADGTTNNFTGQIEDVLGCIALVGDGGCGFEHQLESVRLALVKSSDPTDPDNGGFLRDDADLGIVMLTNEDDCSAPADSRLFDPAISSVSDQPPLGGLWSYRCNEFGHRCDQALPHTAEGLPMTLTGCVSTEDRAGPYHLTPVADFADFLGQVKAPDRRFVSVIAGPYDDASAPYVVRSRLAVLPLGNTELQPEISHSCMSVSGEYGDPAVRLLQFVRETNGVFLPICASDFLPALSQIAMTLVTRPAVRCVNGALAETSTGGPDCTVVLRSDLGSRGGPELQPVASCDAGGPGTTDQPCWRFGPDPDDACPAGHVFQLCYDAGCASAPVPSFATSAVVTCRVE